MQHTISKTTVEKWLKGWSLSRSLPPPISYKSGFKVDVGYDDQKMRYVFPELTDDFTHLAATIDEPWVFLKICASPEKIKKLIPDRWTIQPQGYMMTCFQPMGIPANGLSDSYHLEVEHYNSASAVSIVTQGGELASKGHIALVDDMAVYDRIITAEKHRRKGLGAFLMKELEKLALSKGVMQNFLVATEEGKFLYQSLGWEVYCIYTSVVIPG